MAHPYTTAADNPNLRTLTDAGIAHLRKLNERDQQELELLRAERARHQAEINSIDDVMADLYDSIGRREAKMRGDHISLLPPVPPPASEPFPVASMFEPGLTPEREAAAERFNAAHDELTRQGDS
ncbi:hypothetical protein ACQEUU_37005 [Nonomuraea sp. CA-218870]|uniref:hypothetical protein n=1 Tax=Nonomuraea sp. CA-218870 TaxID=3239998 RepID=UPI003D93FC31